MDNKEKIKEINKHLKRLEKLLYEAMYGIKHNGLAKAINRLQETKYEKNHKTRV